MLVLAVIAFNLTRAAGVLASTFHAKATTATIRAQLIAVPGRLVRTARRLVLHLPRDWPWQAAWAQLHTTVTATGPTRPGLTPDHRPAGPDRSYRQWRSRTDRRTRHTPTTEQDHSAGRPDVLRHHIGSGGSVLVQDIVDRCLKTPWTDVSGDPGLRVRPLPGCGDEYQPFGDHRRGDREPTCP
jgi:hypothetical protein